MWVRWEKKGQLDGQSVWVRWEKKGTARWTECVGEMGDDRYS